MKRKGQRDIPDFAPRHATPTTPAERLAAAGKGPRPPVARQPVNVKPQATSAKSGRRGQ